MLEEPCQLLLDDVGARAVGTAVRAGADRGLRLDLQLALLVGEQVQPDFVALHPSLTTRSPSASAGASPGLGRGATSRCRRRSRRHRRPRPPSNPPDPAGSPSAIPPKASSAPLRSRWPRL